MTAKNILPSHAPKMFGAKKVGDVVTIHLGDDLGFLDAEYLGSGRFTTAYKWRDLVYLFVFFEDFSKSILAQAKRACPKNQHLPTISRIGRFHYDKYLCNVYKSRFYARIDEATISQNMMNIITTLAEAHDEASNRFPHDVVRTYECRDFNNIIINHPDLPIRLREALAALADASEDWGDHYLFDNFHQRNLGLNKRGGLVLIDPMFDMEKIRDDYRARRKRNDRKIET